MKLKHFLLSFATVLVLWSCTSNDEPITLEVDERIKYLSFQYFASGSTDPVSDYAVLGKLQPKTNLEGFIEELQSKIGQSLTDKRKLAVTIGPLALDHDDAAISSTIADAFDVALDNNIAVGFHIDDGMFWAGRPELWSNPENIEWSDWNGTLSESRYVDWIGKKLAPHMCFNATEVKIAMKFFIENIGVAIKEGMEKLIAQQKEDLFAGIIIGWETSLDKDANSDMRLGYHAMFNRGYSINNTPSNPDQERLDIVKEYIELMAASLHGLALPKDKIFGHIAFISKSSYSNILSQNPNFDQTYYELNGFAVPEIMENISFQAGFTTYPQEGLFDEIYSLEKGQLKGWCSAEAANIKLDMPPSPSDYSMETYLAKHYNYGASMVNLFAFGLRGDSFVNAINDATEGPEAIKAYRKFLNGEKLQE